MFKIINSDKEDLIIIEAGGKITKEDYLEVLKPFLDNIKDSGEKVRLLFHTNQDFNGYTAGAAWEDLKLGIHHFLTFKKCAIVTDVSWLRNSCKFFSILIPCPVKIFEERDLDQAKTWLASDHISLTCNFDEEKSLLTVEVKDSLSSEDFKILSQKVDPWIEKNGELKGIIIHVTEFPYWENFAGLISHLSFVKNHHRKVKKVALVADGAVVKFAPKLASHFVKAEIKNFEYNQMVAAREWIFEK